MPAERAAALGSYDQAASLLRQALTVASQPADRADVLERLGLAIAPTGRYADAVAALDAGIEAATAVGDRTAVARLTRAKGEALIHGKDMDEARRVLEAAVTAFGDLPDEALVLGIKAQLSRCYLLMDEDRKAVALVDEILDRAEHGGHMAILADALVTKGTALGFTGRIVEGTALLDAGARLAEDHGLGTTRLRALNNQLVINGDVDPLKAYQATLEGLALARKVGSMTWARAFAGNLGFVAWRVGEWDIAEAELRAALEERPEPGDAVNLLSNLIPIVATRGGPTDELIADLERAAATLPAQVTRPIVPDCEAFVAQAAGRHGEAADHWLQAAGDGLSTGAQSLLNAALSRIWAGDVAGARQAAGRYDELQLHMPGLLFQRDAIGGALEVMEGRGTEGREALEASHRHLLGMGLPDDAARIALTAALLGPTSDPAVTAMVQQARTFWDGVHAAAMLRLLDDAVGGPSAESRDDGPSASGLSAGESRSGDPEVVQT